MRTLSYYLEPSAELELALNTLIEHIPCFVEWYPLEEDKPYLMVKIDCREEDTTFVKNMLEPFFYRG